MNLSKIFFYNFNADTIYFTQLTITRVKDGGLVELA